MEIKIESAPGKHKVQMNELSDLIVYCFIKKHDGKDIWRMLKRDYNLKIAYSSFMTYARHLKEEAQEIEFELRRTNRQQDNVEPTLIKNPAQEKTGSTGKSFVPKAKAMTMEEINNYRRKD